MKNALKDIWEFIKVNRKLTFWMIIAAVGTVIWFVIVLKKLLPTTFLEWAGFVFACSSAYSGTNLWEKYLPGAPK